MEEVTNPGKAGDGKDLGEGEEEGMGGGLEDEAGEVGSGIVKRRRSLHEVIDDLRLPALHVHPLPSPPVRSMGWWLEVCWDPFKVCRVRATGDGHRAQP